MPIQTSEVPGAIPIFFIQGAERVATFLYSPSYWLGYILKCRHLLKFQKGGGEFCWNPTPSPFRERGHSFSKSTILVGIYIEIWAFFEISERGRG